jgi:hypothetical protein
VEASGQGISLMWSRALPHHKLCTIPVKTCCCTNLSASANIWLCKRFQDFESLLSSAFYTMQMSKPRERTVRDSTPYQGRGHQQCRMSAACPTKNCQQARSARRWDLRAANQHW